LVSDPSVDLPYDRIFSNASLPGLDFRMDQERERQRRTYRLCRAGFGLLSFSLVIAAVTTILSLVDHFFPTRFVAWLVQTKLWYWSDVPVVWGSVIGTYLLWGRWSDSGWQRRTGLLLVMCLFDVFTWFLKHDNELGLRLNDLGHDWLWAIIGQALGWAQFALIASLSGDLLAHLGIDQAPEAGKSTRSLAATGSIVWFLFILELIALRARPMRAKPAILNEVWLLYCGYQMIWSIALIQVTALSIAATRQTSRLIAEMDREDKRDDLFGNRSEDDLELLSVQHDTSSSGANAKFDPWTR